MTLTVRLAGEGLFFIGVDDGSATEPLQGAGHRLTNWAPGETQEFIAHVDPNGRPIVYVQVGAGTSQPGFYAVDLIDDAGGELVSGPLTVWMSSGGFEHYVAGVSQTGEVLLWKRVLDNTGWAFVNLTDALDGARPIVSELFNTGEQTSALGVIHELVPGDNWTQALAGFDANGDMVVYMLRPDTEPFRTSQWEFVDVEAGGIDNGVIPDLVGGLSGWSATWGAVHFAGVDANGDLWSIWWGEGMAQWRVDNLSAESGADPLFLGRPAAVQTSWNSFHIFATDTDGDVVVTWWGPGFQSWVHQNLTEDLGGTNIQAGTVAAMYTPMQRSLNVVGIDHQGEAAIYWWNPGLGWQINSISATSSPSEVPLGPQTLSWALYDTESSPRGITQSYFGTDDNGGLIRLTWRSRSTDIWFFEVISDASVPFFR